MAELLRLFQKMFPNLSKLRQQTVTFRRYTKIIENKGDDRRKREKITKNDKFLNIYCC